MLKIREHLDECPVCRAEYQSLRDTKHLLASLALQAPRAEFEALLHAEVERAPGAPWGRVPMWLTPWRDGAASVPRPTPLAAALALSVVALFFATPRLDAPPDTAASVRVAAPQVPPPYLGQPPFYEPALPLAHPTPLLWNAGSSPIVPVRFDREEGNPPSRR